jgi:histidinol-phosphate aminotransferase
MAPGEIERILQASEGFVVVDEAYLEFNDQPSAQALMKAYPNLLLMRTLSKAFGLAGLRLGYLMGPPRIIREMLKARLPFMVDRFSEAVALALLDRPGLLAERVAQLKTSIRRLTTELASMPGVEVLPSQTNFVLFRTQLEPDVMMGRLAGAGILVRNMGGYPELRGYLRVTAGTDSENKAFLTALKEANQK